jgi:osmoprotectant transport system substrate-binding protein
MRTRIGIVAISVLAAAALAACSSADPSSGSPSGTAPATNALPGADKPPVIIGTKNFPEQFILGELYAGALAAKGYTVTVKSNVGSTEVIDKALTSGQVDMYPEYTGSILSILAHQANQPKTAEETLVAAKAFEETRGLTVLNAAPYTNSDTLTVLTSYANEHNLRSIGDLAALGTGVTIGAAPAFEQRRAGMLGLKSEYGLNAARFKPLGIGLAQKALDAGEVQAADIFSTTPILQDKKYTVLTDPKAIFGFQNLAPVVSKDVLAKQGPAFAETLNKVSALLTLDAIRAMNDAVSTNHLEPKAVAQQFLKANGLA